MIRRLLIVALLAVALTACKGETKSPVVAVPSTSVSTTSTTTVEQARAAELAGDLKLIKAFYRAASDSWGDPSNNHQTAVDWTVAHDYPGLVTAAQCRKNAEDRLSEPNYREEYVLDVNSVERDDGWMVPAPPMKGQTPQGRIYIVKLTVSREGYGPTESSTDEVHITILNGAAYDFITCG
jgi:hypothetical protein